MDFYYLYIGWLCTWKRLNIKSYRDKYRGR